MSRRKKKFDIGNPNDPISCHECEFHICYMKKVGKGHYRSQYKCRITNNEIPKKITILIPKWCPKGYKNLFDL